jgi:hypothetical protein
VDQARLRADVRSLVGFGPRHGGSPSGDRAAAWLEARFRALGLRVAATMPPGADVLLPRRYRGEDTTTLRVPATTVDTAAWDAPRVLAQTPG